jgi:hypothetical protein
MAPALKTFVATLALGLSFLALGAVPAAAKAPCWQLVINDWYDGRIDHTYPIACYQQAIQHLPEDVKDYSGAADEISRAMFAAIHQDRGDPGSGGSGGASAGPGGGGSGPTALAGGADKPPKGFVERLLDGLGPANAGSVPLPLLILAGIAIVLLAAAGASFLARRIQARRMTPATAPAPVRPNPDS